MQHLPELLPSLENSTIIHFDKDTTLETELLNTLKLKSDKSKGTSKKTPQKVRVGLVKSIELHPGAEKFIDLGEAAHRDICSGLVQFLKSDEILEKKVCVIANMKPKSLRGKPSNGMVLCVSNDDHSAVELLEPPADAEIGERVMWEGYNGEPDLVLNTKTGKDPFIAVKDYFVCKDRVGYYKEARFMTSKGPCTCKSITKGTIS
ncbi:bifunctional Nucleic acid-binding [Babesia duncani]|uniref:Bifunctional Nucleic acid-binding n=1 Tax=Babesia duncani TaxID=323732 RepID=A0AAD9UN29_9APIC|nr:bifunctional Nucleic acid-binding [Babesia duncani]